MTALLALLLALQTQRPQVTASVDRTRVAMGEELTLTVRARSRSSVPVQFQLPTLDGFSVLASHDVTDVAVSGAAGPLRTTTRELRLRADHAGTLVIGRIRARQGTLEMSTDPIGVTVDSGAPGVLAGLSPIARALLDAAPPPRDPDRVSLSIVVPSDTVTVGEQVDVVAAAWFPRELRARLTAPPVLTLRAPDRVWAYPLVTPDDVALSRSVRGRWMDLYVAHQIVFPLSAGEVSVPPATLAYGVHTAFSLFSGEANYSLTSDPVRLAVLPLPAAGQQGDDQGVVGEDLALDVTVDPLPLRVGEPAEMRATVRGTGNVALWPDPVVHFPLGLRAYAEAPLAAPESRGGRVAGGKTFRWLLVPDSAGTATLPEVRYSYYDLARGAYQLARVAPRPLVVAPGDEPRAARPLPPLEGGAAHSLSDAVVRELGPGEWLAILILPPLAAWAARRRRRPPSAAPAAPRPHLSRLGRLERDFHGVLTSHVPDAVARDGDGLAQALRAAGIESAVADHVMRLRDRLRASRYGPRGVGDAAELEAELHQVLGVLGAERSTTRRRRSGALLVLLACGLTAAARAQAPDAERLYEAGALRAAADSFARRAALDSLAAAHWYNLGAALYRAGADGKAVAAWTLAARLAPRDRVIRRARALLPPPDASSETLLAVGPASPGEWALLAGIPWILCWGVAVSGRRPLVALGFAGAALVAAAAGVGEWQRRVRPVAVILAPATPVRAAPYSSANAATTLDPGAAAEIVGSFAAGRWLELARSDGVRGWVLAREVARL
ncbi:MAG TPA: BatD family protein [Gemmatimonadales bacterium]|nr:BatD family protein [Gemmatimonadales bacterium]